MFLRLHLSSSLNFVRYGSCDESCIASALISSEERIGTQVVIECVGQQRSAMKSVAPKKMK